MKSILGEIRKNNKGTSMKIIRYNGASDIDVEFLDEFHYIKEHCLYINFKNGQIKNTYDRTVYEIGYIETG